MNATDTAISIFNVIVQHKAMTGRNPTIDEIRAALHISNDTAAIKALFGKLSAWDWIRWDGYNVESAVITRVTEVQHPAEDVERVLEQAERVMARKARKERRERAAGMYAKSKPGKAAQPRRVETPEQKLAHIRSHIKHFTG